MRLRRLGTAFLGLALLFVCFVWVRAAATHFALDPDSPWPGSWMLIGFTPWVPGAVGVLSLSCAGLVFRGSVIANWVGAVLLAFTVVLIILTGN